MENGEHGESRGIIKTAQRILVMMSAKQQPLGRIFSMHSPSIRPALTFVLPISVNKVSLKTLYMKTCLASNNSYSSGEGPGWGLRSQKHHVTWL